MMTEANQSLEEIKRLKIMLEAEKQEFLSVMSHELRTPMTEVKGYLSMVLEGDSGSIPAKAKEYLAQAYVANDRLIRLVSRMLKIAKIQEKEFEFKLSKVDFAAQADQVVKDCDIRAKDKNISLQFVPAKEKLLVRGDPDRVREVLLTLTLNAIKFTHEKGQITVSLRQTPSWIVADVQDSGIGIQKEDQERIFQLFSKGNLTLTGQERGTGIGLYLSKRLAEAQGGKVWLENSAVGQGSTFSFALRAFK
jgi:signal transduction histidine kinase